ncbi:hypothetical protein [Streptomyces sp. NPDC051994]|uniref:hypothetical protein n=1 Tax=unclassified Streptomyces TaxID=2593676 RepID=UPI003420AA37
MIQHGLPHRLLLDRVENLMFPDPAPTRLGHERLASAGQPIGARWPTVRQAWAVCASRSRVGTVTGIRPSGKQSSAHAGL